MTLPPDFFVGRVFVRSSGLAINIGGYRAIAATRLTCRGGRRQFNIAGSFCRGFSDCWFAARGGACGIDTRAAAPPRLFIMASRTIALFLEARHQRPRASDRAAA